MGIKSFLKALKGYLSVETYIRMGAFFFTKSCSEQKLLCLDLQFPLHKFRKLISVNEKIVLKLFFKAKEKAGQLNHLSNQLTKSNEMLLLVVSEYSQKT